jgi:hypothetical protein
MALERYPVVTFNFFQDTGIPSPLIEGGDVRDAELVRKNENIHPPVFCPSFFRIIGGNRI